MMQSFAIAFLSSFLGALPVGVLNTTSAKVAIEQSFMQVIWFCLGVCLIEAIQVLIAFQIAGWLVANEDVAGYINLASVPLFALLGFYYFIKQSNPNSSANLKGAAFRKGIFLSSINLLAIPFWATIISVMRLNLSIEHMNAFVLGGILGTLLVLQAYALLGVLLQNKLLKYHPYFNKVLAVVCWSVSLIILTKWIYYANY